MGSTTSQPNRRCASSSTFVYEAGGPVVVDLAHATFVDSTVLGTIAADWQGDGDEAAGLALVAPTTYAGSRLIELVGVGEDDCGVPEPGGRGRPARRLVLANVCGYCRKLMVPSFSRMA